MPRVLSPVAVVVGLVGLNLGFGAAAVSAAPSPAPVTSAVAGAKPVPGKKVCTIKDPRLTELSGMVATKTGFVVINDGSEDGDAASREKIFFLNRRCRVQDVVSYSGGGPRDTEDLALSPDGQTLWIADIGDNTINKERRASVALWTMPADGSKKPVINRLTYPDGPHDAEALLFAGDGSPIIVTKEVSGPSKLYAPTAPLTPDTAEGVPMKKIGEVKLPKTSSEHPLGAVARLLITGGANAPGGGRVVLRTYTDAFEWDVTNGDVVGALANGVPRLTVLPNEPIGEAITYNPAGNAFLTVSETAGLGVDPVILSYPPATHTAPAVKPAGGDDKGDGKSWLDYLGLDGITYLIGAVGVLGAILVGVGVVGILRFRNRPAAAGVGSVTGRQPVLASAGYGGDDTGGRYQSGRSYDGYQPARGRPSGGAYGGESGGGVYGGGRSGGVYGGSGGGGVYGGRSDDRAGNGYPGRGYDDDGHRGHRPDDGYGYR